MPFFNELMEQKEQRFVRSASIAIKEAAAIHSTPEAIIIIRALSKLENGDDIKKDLRMALNCERRKELGRGHIRTFELKLPMIEENINAKNI